MRGERGSQRIAFVTPLPPAPTGVAHHSLRLAEELAATGGVEVDLFAEELANDGSEPIGPPGIPLFGVGSLAEIEATRGPYDRVLVALGNSDQHIGGLELLAHRSGIVLAHDVRLTNLYYFAAEAGSAAVPDGFPGALSRLYDEDLPPGLGEGRRLDPAEEEHYGILMAGEVIGWAERYLVTSRAARALAMLDAGPDATGKIGVVPFAAEVPVPGSGGFDSPGDTSASPPTDCPVIVALGIMHSVRQPLRLLEAFARTRVLVPEARLAYVGPAPDELAEEVVQGAERLGISAHVAVTGRVGTDRYLEWLRRATIAVQLRGYWNGEAALTVGECLAAGVPAIVSDLGWARELPDDCVRKLDPRATADELGTLMARLLQDDSAREALSKRALAFAPELSYKRAAEAIVNELFTGAP